RAKSMSDVRGIWPATRSTRSCVSCHPCVSPTPENWRAVMRNVIVTGGSRGLGLTTLRKLASAGDRVIAIARRETDALACAIAESKAASKGAIHFRAFDLANLAEIGDLVRSIRGDFGPIYGLVNN